MQKQWLRGLLPHVIAILVFLLVAIVYCSPVFQGKVLYQEDVSQWNSMAHNSIAYQQQHGKLPLWSQGMFSGMPGFQIDMDAQVQAPQYFLYKVFTLFMQKPVSFFFLASVCFYFLSQVLRTNPYVGMIASLAYAYATFNALIIVAGHDTKMQSIAILPAFIGSLILIYERKYWWGAALTALFSAMFVSVNHFQILYYGLIIAGAMTIGYIFIWIKQKQYKHMVIAGLIAISCGMIGVGCNAVLIFTTYDYSKATIRGGSQLAGSSGQFTKTGLSEGYAFQYSMYQMEPFVLLVPKMFGGGDGLELAEDNSKAIEALQSMPPELGRQLQQLQLMDFYWGGIGGTSGPPYAGAIICFLALLGMFLLDNKYKWWIAATFILAIMMSWGGYFSSFNGWLLKNLPGYNKFRAPSVIIVIAEFLLCMLAVLTLDKLWKTGSGWKAYKRSLILTAGIFVVLLLVYYSSDYLTAGDRSILKRASQAGTQALDYVKSFEQGMREDRQGLFLNSLIRSFLFIAGAALAIGLYLKGKLIKWAFIGVVGVLSFVDLMGINVKYLHTDSYQDEADHPNGAIPSAADQQILKDTSYYRVFDLRNGPSTALVYGAKTSSFHRSIGGYHPAKLSIYQDLIEHILSKYPDCSGVVNMLNTKYIIQRDGEGREIVLPNAGALGPAWFVKAVSPQKDAAAVMNALTNFSPRDTAIIFENTMQYARADPAGADSTPGRAGRIALVKNDNDEMVYRTISPVRRFAVFSEVYYDRGWKAYIDDVSETPDPGHEIPVVRTNYVLRGLSVPAGEHTIRFVFHPNSYYTGQWVQRISAWILTLLLLAAIGIEIKRQMTETRIVPS